MVDVTKVLAGAEDIMFGNDSVVQTRAGADYTIKRINKLHPVANKAALEALPVNDPNKYYHQVLLLGTTVSGDTGSGILYHNPATLKSAADGVTIIVDSSVGLTGCWHMLISEGEKARLVTGVYTTANLSAGATERLDIVHGLDVNDIDFGASITGTATLAAGMADVGVYMLGSDKRITRMGHPSYPPTPLAVPASLSLQIGVKNGTIAQAVTVRWWASERLA